MGVEKEAKPYTVDSLGRSLEDDDFIGIFTKSKERVFGVYHGLSDDSHILLEDPETRLINPLNTDEIERILLCGRRDENGNYPDDRDLYFGGWDGEKWVDEN